MNHEITLAVALVLVLAGAFGGFLNTVASSGSAVTLPIMIFLGLGPMMANSTNRVPVVVGLAVAVWKYHRSGQLPWAEGLKLALPTVAGAIIGTLLAASLDDGKTGNLTTFAVLAAMLLVLLNPSKWLNANQSSQTKNSGPLVLGALFVVGIWTGLIVLDSGTYFLAVLVLLAHYPLREANAIKVLTMALPSLMAVIIFTAKGEINWLWAIPLSIGGIVGSLIGARLSLGPNAHKWIFWMLVLVLGFQGIQLAFRFL
jgi:uncharacterized membrane protein YfcA